MFRLPPIPALLTTAMLLAVPAAGHAQAAPWSVFGTQETQSVNMAPFKKWTEAINRSLQEKSTREGSCQAAGMNACHFGEWQKFLEGLKGARKITQLREVNEQMNRSKYITDPVNWNVDDYWESPGEFLDKMGDCEDYAIAKYFSLKQLGFPVSSMRVVAVQDMNLKVGHAVLLVNLDGTLYLLDNQVKEVAKSSAIKHYNPIFSINEEAWWKHRR